MRDCREPLPTRVDLTPSLPPEYDAVLERGLDTLGVRLGPDERQAIDGHARLLLAWTQAINLTAIRDPAVVAREHVLDSLSALPLLRGRGVESVLDIDMRHRTVGVLGKHAGANVLMAYARSDEHSDFLTSLGEVPVGSTTLKAPSP